ncbi:MAG: hypothetical protein ACOX5R_06850 [bacterium]|jgi:hypothetical protein
MSDTQKKYQNRYTWEKLSKSDRQPEEWEELLKDVTVERNFRERTIDPQVLLAIQGQINFTDLMELRPDWVSQQELGHQVELVREIAEHKLSGLSKTSLLILLSTGMTYIRIAELLGVTKDKVQRAVQSGVEKIREILSEPKTGDFPAKEGKRPPIRASIFPLDTAQERIQFQEFLNRKTVLHLSYSGDRLFREVLVVYVTGKRRANHIQDHLEG